MIHFVGGHLLLLLGAVLLGQEFGYKVGLASWLLFSGVAAIVRAPREDEVEGKPSKWYER